MTNPNFVCFLAVSHAPTRKEWRLGGTKTRQIYCSLNIWELATLQLTTPKTITNMEVSCWKCLLLSIRFMSQEARVSSCAVQGFHGPLIGLFSNYGSFNSNSAMNFVHHHLMIHYPGFSWDIVRQHVVVVSYPLQHHCDTSIAKRPHSLWTLLTRRTLDP